MKSAVIGSTPTRPRMPSVPKYTFLLMRGLRCNAANDVSLHRLRGLVGIDQAGERRLDLRARRIALGRVGELYADAGDAVALRARRREPHHLAGDAEALGVVEQGQQKEYVVADRIALCGRHEQTAAAQKWHIGVVELALFLDHQRQNAECASWSCHRKSPRSQSRPPPVWSTRRAVRAAQVRAAADRAAIHASGWPGRTTPLAWTFQWRGSRRVPRRAHARVPAPVPPRARARRRNAGAGRRRP